MRHLLYASAILLFVSAFPDALAAQELSDPDRAARAAAEEWIQLIDDAEYPESWSQTDPAFRSAMTSEQWSTTLADVAQRTGELVSRTFAEVVPAPANPNAPPGDIVMIHYRSSFENVPEVTERIVVRDTGDGEWKVAGYFLMPTR